VYTSWVAAAADGRYGELLLAEVGGRVAGLCTYLGAGEGEVSVGTIGLLVISPPYRGRHLLDPLVRACAAAAGGHAVVTSTQVSNAVALRAFARCGLLPYSARHVLHGWL